MEEVLKLEHGARAEIRRAHRRLDDLLTHFSFLDNQVFINELQEEAVSRFPLSIFKLNPLVFSNLYLFYYFMFQNENTICTI
jgi:hypothetical protein